MASTHDAVAPAVGAAAYRANGLTFKQRAAVQQAVRRLLDSLAPERAAARADAPISGATLRRVRSPRGCILQGAARAVSVSWFAARDNDATLGELQVIVWRGVVTRPGSTARTGEGAEPLWRAVLRPIEREGGAWAWRAADDRVFESVALAARCQAFIEEQSTETAPAGGPD